MIARTNAERNTNVLPAERSSWYSTSSPVRKDRAYVLAKTSHHITAAAMGKIRHLYCALTPINSGAFDVRPLLFSDRFAVSGPQGPPQGQGTGCRFQGAPAARVPHLRTSRRPVRLVFGTLSDRSGPLWVPGRAPSNL
jgi:hypothetical protein